VTAVDQCPLLRCLRLPSEPTRTLLLMIALSVTIAGLGGIFFNLLLASPFVDDFNYLWTGPPFTAVRLDLLELNQGCGLKPEHIISKHGPSSKQMARCLRAGGVFFTFV
jgi:hypothetical protein